MDELFVTALPEEFFYRGYLQARLSDVWPGRCARRWACWWDRRSWLTAALFALGHLAIFQGWRLAVFFPALLFGWLRERTGTIVGAHPPPRRLQHPVERWWPPRSARRWDAALSRSG